MNNQTELISVIIPTYKRNETLKRAIDSINNQTYKNLEIIVVDDNSKYPETRKKNRELIKSYLNKIVYIENKSNLGGGLTRNEGIKAAKGKYIAFLDDDDEYYPTKIEEQYNLYKELKNENIALIYCYAEMINTDGTSYYQKKSVEGNNIEEHVRDCIAATSWWFCSRDKLISVNGFEDISSRQDASLILKLLLKGYEIYCVPKVLLKYYWHDSKNGISKIDYKAVEAEKKYRDVFINNYSDSANVDKNNILYLFSYRIAMLYILLKDRKNAIIEYKEMKKYKSITCKNFRILFGIVFNRTYCFISRTRNRKRGASNGKKI